MRGIRTIVILLLLALPAHAQDRLVTLGFFGADAEGRFTPALIEADIAGTRVGPARSVTSLPSHFISDQLLSLAGGRYLAWLAAINSGSLDCREYVAIFDRRLGTARVVPNLAIPCRIAQLIADPLRPRIFVHTSGGGGRFPKGIAVIDETLTLRPIMVSDRLTDGFAYAPAVDQLFVTESGRIGSQTLSVVALNAATGERLNSFPVPYYGGLPENLAVTSDGRRVFFWAHGSTLSDLQRPIHAFDANTGVEVARSRPIMLRGDDHFVLDEQRNLLLTPHSTGSAPSRHQLFGFDADTLALVYEADPGHWYPPVSTFQPLRGRGEATAYLLIGRRSNWTPDFGSCEAWLDAFNGAGALQSRTELVQMAGVIAPGMPGFVGCPAGGVMLSPPHAPSALVATVAGRRVTLRWSNPGDTSGFELEAGFAPGRRDLAVRIGLVTEISADDVPPGVYYVRVRAVNEMGVSPVSNEVRVLVP